MGTNFLNIVNGVGIGSSSGAPANPKNGDIYYDTSLNAFQKYENGGWGSLAANATIQRSQIASSTADAVVINDASGNLSSIALTDGQLAIGSSVGAPAAGNISGTNILVTNGHNTIAISIPQSVATSATPTFAGLTLSSPLTVANGGTGQASFTAGDILYGNGTSGLSTSANLTFASNTLSLGASNNVNLASSSAISIGDTTQSPSAAGAGAIRFHSSSLQFSDGTTWQTLTDSATGVTTLNTFSGAVTIVGTANEILVNNTSNTITLSTPQAIATSSTPTFAGMTLSGDLLAETQVKFQDSTTNTVNLKAPSSVTTYTLTLPAAVATANNAALVSDTSGNLTYQQFDLAATGDIQLTSFTAADNQSSPANVTGYAFANATVRAFDAIVSVTRGSTYQNFTMNGVQKASSWEMSQTFVGDDAGLVFTITTAGQVQYTSTSTGNTATVKFRAWVTTV